MTGKAKSCSHPRICRADNTFTERIKTDKLSLQPPPPDLLVKPPH